MKIKGESMDWNSRVFNLLLKSMINEAVELSFSQIHANRDRKGYTDQLQIYWVSGLEVYKNTCLRFST
jgi:hypothetical protein